MYRTSAARLIVRCVATAGVALALLLAGGAPVDFTHRAPVDFTHKAVVAK